MCKLLVKSCKGKGSHAEADAMRFVSASTVHTAAERAFLLLFTVVLLFKSKSLLCFRTRVVAVATKLEVAELTAVAVEVTRSPLSFSASDVTGGRCSCLCRWWCLLLPKHAGMVIYHWNDGESTLYEQSTPAYFYSHWIKNDSMNKVIQESLYEFTPRLSWEFEV